MKYKSPKQHNNVLQTILEEAIKKIIKTKHYVSADIDMLTNVLDYHQQINDKEIERMFYEDFVQMQKELPVIHVDSDLLSIITKHVAEYGFALTHGLDGEYMSTALLHKAGYKVSIESKSGLNTKRTNVINMLSLVIKDENLTKVEHKNTFVEDTSLKQQFMEAVEFAVGNGYDIYYKFGEAANTLEYMFTIMLRWQAKGDAGYDACIQAYNSAFYNQETGRYDNKGMDGECIDSDNEETPDIATQFINAIEYATKHGETKDYQFGTLQYTLEQAYENMIRRQDEGSDECDACIKAYRDAFINNKEQ